MNKSKQLKALVQTTFAAVVAAVAVSGMASMVFADEPKSDVPAPTNSVAQNAAAPDTGTPAVKSHLTGAELYSINCYRCHPERYPTERTAAQWKTIMLHMQVRANIPGSQARLILQYLQDNSGR